MEELGCSHPKQSLHKSLRSQEEQDLGLSLSHRPGLEKLWRSSTQFLKQRRSLSVVSGGVGVEVCENLRVEPHPHP